MRESGAPFSSARLKYHLWSYLGRSGFGGAHEGHGADEAGGATFLPLGISVPEGLEFSAKLVNGRPIRGAMKNDLGYAFSPVDGYGLVNTQERSWVADPGP